MMKASLPTHARLGFGLWMLLALTAGSPTPCIAGDGIALRPDGEIRKTTVRLSDLFSNVPPETDTEIAQAPAPGKEAVYESRVLAKLAQKYHLDWEPQGAADHVTLTSPASHITTDALRDALLREIKAAGAKGDIELAFDGHAPAIDLPGNQKPVFTIANFDYDSSAKRFRAEVVTDSAAGPSSLPVAGKVSIKRHVPVLARRLESGTLIGPDDIDWIDASDEKLGPNAVTEAAELVGHELRHTVSDGEIMHSGDIMPARLVKRGSLVTMKIESPFMSLTAQGRALQDGTQGETVRVVNTASNRLIEATVDGPDTVAVHISQQLALNP